MVHRNSTHLSTSADYTGPRLTDADRIEYAGSHLNTYRCVACELIGQVRYGNASIGSLVADHQHAAYEAHLALSGEREAIRSANCEQVIAGLGIELNEVS